MPNTISKTAALAHILDLIKLLKGHKPHHPLAKYSDDTLTALDNLQDILTTPPKSVVPIKPITKAHNSTKLLRVHIDKPKTPPTSTQ